MTLRLFYRLLHTFFGLAPLSFLAAGALLIENARGAEESAAPPRFITRAVQLLDLSADEAKKEIPVRMQGIVTCFDQAANLCFVFDGNFSVYVYTSRLLDLAAGDMVEISGYSGSGLFSPIVQRVTVTRMGKTNLPPAKSVTLDQLASGREDSQFIQIEGIVQNEWTDSEGRFLKMGTGNSALEVCLSHVSNIKESLLDSKIRVQGVVVARRENKTRRIQNQVFVSPADQIQIIEPGSTIPFEKPILRAEDLLSYSHQGRSEHRVHMRGVVTAPIQNGVLYIRDESGPIRVEMNKTNGVLAVGEMIDCVGFVAGRAYSAAIGNAEYKSEKKRGDVKDIPVSFAQAASEKFDSDLVQMQAIVIKTEAISENESALLLESNQRTFRAFVEVPENKLYFPFGAKVKVTGICVVEGPEPHFGSGFRILTRGIKDLEILSLPPWWTNRSSPWVVGFSLVALSGVGFALMTRRRLVAQSDALNAREKLLADQVQAQVAREIESRTQIEQELRLREQQLQESIQERERIGRDLHDGLIQSIYAIGLNIEDCTCSVPPSAPEVRTYLGKIKNDLNRVIQEVRNFILGIESSTVTGSEFKTALKSMVLTMAERQQGKARIDVDRRAAEELSPDQATQLLHVAREAMTNCLRHADAELVVLSLLRHGSHIRFEVKDNGKGFNVNLPASGGFGLRNMAARAAEIGAAYTLVSEIGGGTRIVLDFEPKKKVSS